MHYSKHLIILLVGILPLALFAQDITGLWKGTLYNDTTKKYYRYEIGISEEKGKLSGFSHTFFLDGDKEFYGVKKVKVKKTEGKIIIEDAGLIANNYPVAPAKGVRQLNVLTLEIKDSIMVLTGPFTTNRTKEYSALTGTVSLQRKNDFRQSALVPHLQELGMSDDLSFVKKDNERIKEEKKADEIVIANNEKTTLAAKNNAIQKAEEKKSLAINTIKPVKESLIKGKTTIKETATPEKKEAIIAKTSGDEKIETAVINATPEKNETTTAEPVKKDEKKSTAGKETKANASAAVVTKSETSPALTKQNEPAAEVEKRTTILQQTVFFSSDSLQLSLYDNGEVDGDTVSVLMNGKIIMAKEGLSTKAVQKTIYAGHDTDSIELVMYAENLGAIAPNTGLLVVHDGKSIYEIRFSGDLQKNASIIFRRRKK